MGVFDRNGDDPDLGGLEGRSYTCMACEATFEVQYHACPACGGYDVRCAKWVRE